MLGTTQTQLLAGSLWLLALAGCSGGTGPRLRPCTASSFAVSLAVGEYVSVDPGPDSGCTIFPANGAAAAEYLVVPQLATGQPGVTSSFRLTGDTVQVVMAQAAPVGMPIEPSPAQQFHAFLRAGDERGWGGPSLTPRRAAPAVQVNYGDIDQFNVCSRTDCSQFQTVTARARAVKPKVVIFVDTLAPTGGLDSLALDKLAALFEDTLYATDTAAFGRESDIDGNGAVLVLMTGVVNKLVRAQDCPKTGFVAGFFYGADLVPGPQFPKSNAAEIFYSFVADPNGTLSCPHTATDVERFVPVTFVHEFQHMISFNQHVLVRGGNGEVLWLNEGLSHYAEELAGRTYEATPDARLTGCRIGEVVCRFYGGNLLNAYEYLDSTRQHFLLPSSGIGSLAERGAAWLFVRYLVDRYAAGNTAADWNAFTRQLVQTTGTGAANIAAATGQSFQTSVTGWALANWVSDLPGFTAPAELQYESWSLRQAFDTLNAQRPDIFSKVFPLVPSVSSGRQLTLTGALRAGSGIYHRATQNPSSGSFTILFSTSGGGMLNTAHFPRLNVIRIQ